MDFRFRSKQEQNGTIAAAPASLDTSPSEAGRLSGATEQDPHSRTAPAVRFNEEGELAALAMENLLLIEQSLDIIALLDDQGRIVRVNGAITEVTGYLPEEIVGRSCTDFVLQDDRESTQATLAGLVAGSHTVKLFENRWRHKEGGMAVLSWSLRWNGAKRHIHATGRDVTERYKTRVALQQANERMHSLLERIGDGFFALDRDWRLAYANGRALSFLH